MGTLTSPSAKLVGSIPDWYPYPLQTNTTPVLLAMTDLSAQYEWKEKDGLQETFHHILSVYLDVYKVASADLNMVSVRGWAFGIYKKLESDLNWLTPSWTIVADQSISIDVEMSVERVPQV